MVNAMLFPSTPFNKTKTRFWETCIECNNANVFCVFFFFPLPRCEKVRESLCSFCFVSLCITLCGALV